MPPGFFRISLIAFALALAPAAAAQQAEPDTPDKRAPETVHFASLDGRTDLTAYLGRHPRDAPRPAVVLMHGCSGLLNPKGAIFALYRAWMRALFGQGYDVLTVDSASSRGFGQTCTAGPDRITAYRDRPKDAYAALQYLQAQPFVRPDRIGLMGWSQGGAGPGFCRRGCVLSGRLQRAAAVKTLHASRAAAMDHGHTAAGAVRRGRHLDAVCAVRSFHLRRQGARQSGRTEKLSVGGARFRCAEPAA